MSTVADGSAAVVTKPYALRSAHVLRPRGEIRLKVAPCFGNTVSTELIQRVLRQSQTHHGLGHHGCRRHGGAVGTLVDGLCGFAGQHVDRTQGLGDGRNRLHGTAYANHLAIGHTAFNAACAVGQTVDAAVGVDHDLIVRLRTGAGGFQEAVADLHTLERLNAHDRGGQSRVQSAVGLHIRADAGRHTVSQHFNHAAQRIGGLLGLVDAFDDAGFGLFVQRTDRRGIKRFQIVGGGQRQVGVGLHATKRHHVGYGADAERLIQELLGHLAQSHTRGGLTGAGALQYTLFP